MLPLLRPSLPPCPSPPPSSLSPSLSLPLPSTLVTLVLAGLLPRRGYAKHSKGQAASGQSFLLSRLTARKHPIRPGLARRKGLLKSRVLGPLCTGVIRL
mmetsp:Transcript_5303/g.16209  ORF Transcript_5303/g.16209 Transcript_5303/m.16209 type:complete len:99 (+) Transcript_5303:1041-1337(+)|eukprot:scaffold106569_cov31-Tisochrysis_lutea.AAC.1